jgi:hypothetical protein
MFAHTNPALRILAFSVIILSCGRCWAYSVAYYDLDSLVYLSEGIVLGRIGNTDMATGFDVTELKVDSVYMGRHKKGDTIKITGLYAFRKPAARLSDLNSVSLDKDDQVIVFLDYITPKSIRPDLRTRGDTEYRLVGCGIRAVVDGKVMRFYQRGNPGPYVLERGGHSDERPQTLDEFAGKVLETIPRMKDFADRLDAATASKDAKWFLQTLRERAGLADAEGRRGHYTDHLANIAAIRLADLHNPEILDQALQYGTWQTYTIAAGFGTPAGRDYLLNGIRDTKAPQKRRLRLADVLMHADYIYRSRSENVQTNSHERVGKPGTNNDDYITRIARLAAENITNEQLCLKLVQTIDFFGRVIVQTADRDSRADCEHALAVLRQAYKECDSEVLHSAIEMATGHFSRKLYDKLGSRCGPIISRLYYADPKKYAPPKEMSLIFQFEYLVLSKGGYATAVVLLNQETGKRYLLPAKMRPIFGYSSPGMSGGGSGSVVLPNALAKGKYRVYFQFTEDDRVVSTGHYFEIDL